MTLIDLDPFPDAMVEHFGTADERAKLLLELPPVEGEWPFPASLSRLGHDRMPPRMLKRFLKYVEPAQLDYYTPCWLWGGGTHEKGYGRFHLGFDPDTRQRITAYAHRIAFEHWVGFPPPGYIVDHKCNHKICCNPAHLWPVTNEENLRLADQRRPWKRRNQYSKE